MNIGQKDKLATYTKKSEQTLKNALKKKALSTSLLLLEEGKTYEAEQALRMYRALCKKEK